jgi:hypothetical protein
MSRSFSAYKRFKSRREKGVKTLGERGRWKGEGKEEWRWRELAVGKMEGGFIGGFHWWIIVAARKSGSEVC